MRLRWPSIPTRRRSGGRRCRCARSSAGGRRAASTRCSSLRRWRDRTGGEASSRWAAEAAYGLPAFGGRWTGSPHVGLGLATVARDYSVGWRLTPASNANAPDMSFGLRATRRESDTAQAEHTVGVEITARW